ncbi:hypothetical protein BU26DRAFT_214918 [Trematosphaeria pertusa]|uniref:Uncharacterized protein n=1 Tax=Trematosphaeria pertusa TaxID=390896 RepID=A0A6A6IS62_9PLEO|nr:uncharacterized protein BU26DRAFT_214918 [Trematosphaeria pertusa]KAF2253099.1 hypothetical protein BU26DRAFT_214918 [Trematosphaeria pertusa]
MTVSMWSKERWPTYHRETLGCVYPIGRGSAILTSANLICALIKRRGLSCHTLFLLTAGAVASLGSDPCLHCPVLIHPYSHPPCSAF